MLTEVVTRRCRAAASPRTNQPLLLRDCDHGTMIVVDSVDPGAAAEPLGYADILSSEAATVSPDSVDITVQIYSRYTDIQ